MPKAAGWCYRGQGAIATGTTSLTISKSSLVVDDDIMVLMFAHHGAGWGTVPAGWTLINREISGTFRGEMYWRRASGESGTYAVTDLANGAIGQIIAYKGGLLVGDIVDVTVARSNGTTGDGTGAFTNTHANALVIFMAARAASSVGSFLAIVGDAGATTSMVINPELNNLRTRSSGATANGNDAAIAIADAIKIVPGDSLVGTRGILTTGADQVGIVAVLIPETAAETTGTRYYMTRKFPGLPVREPTRLRGSWDNSYLFTWPEHNHLMSTFLLSQRKPGGGVLRSFEWGTNQQPDFDGLIFRLSTPALAAQSISGTVDFIHALRIQFIDNTLGATEDAVGRVKLHIYVSVGQTDTVRATLLDNYLDANTLETLAMRWHDLAAPQTLTPATIEEGDSIIIEMGVRVVSSPPPDTPPSYLDPNFEWIQFTHVGLGTTDPLATTQAGSHVGVADDGVPGVNAALSPNPNELSFFDFSQTLVEATPAAGPTNITPATATELLTIPSASDLIDTTLAASPGRAVWYKVTATRTGTLLITTFGSSALLRIQAFTGDPSNFVAMTLLTTGYTNSRRSGHRALTALALPVTDTVTYYIRVYVNGLVEAASGGGWGRLTVSYQETPQADDVFMAATSVAVYREGILVNWTPDFQGLVPHGLAFDYTQRPMDDLNGGTHSGYRLLLSLFGGSLQDTIEIVDATDLSRGTFEIDYISAGFTIVDDGITYQASMHPSFIHVSAAGVLYVQHIGDGLLYAVGPVLGGEATVFLSDPASEPEFGAVRGIDATHGDNQAGAPWPWASVLFTSQGAGPPWTGAVDENGVLYYGVSGMYFSLPNTQVIKRYDLVGDTQLADFATLPSFGSNPGVRGMCWVPNTGLIVTNGDRAHLLNTVGTIVRSYTPSTSASRPVALFDAKITADGQSVWLVDNPTADLFKFDIDSGAELLRVETGLGIGNAMQLAIFQPGGITPPVLTIPPSFNTIARTIRRVRQAPHLSDDQRRLVYTQFQLDLQAGVGLTSGQGSDPTVFLSWSDDGGHTWSNEYPMSAGALGDHEKRVVWRRLGQSRDRIFRVTMSDPVDWVLLDAFIKFVDGRR